MYIIYIIYICIASLRMHIYIYSTSYTRAEIWGDSETSPGHLQAERDGNSSSCKTNDQLTFKRTFWSSRFWISMFLMVIPTWWLDFVHKDPLKSAYFWWFWWFVSILTFSPRQLGDKADFGIDVRLISTFAGQHQLGSTAPSGLQKVSGT